MTEKIGTKQVIKTALSEGIPLALATMTYGISYGIMAKELGFSSLETMLMSLFVYSGSVQLVALSMVKASAATISIFFTIALLNLRNILYGIVLSSYLGKKRTIRWILANNISDEQFILGMNFFKKHGSSPLYYSILFGIIYLAWIVSSFIGMIASSQINPEKLGLDLAFPATLAIMFIPSLVDITTIVTALSAMLLCLILELLFPRNDFTIIICALVTPLIALYFKKKGTTDNE